jgi:hypothetical protein
MAILSTSELKTSREAIDAGVSTAPDADVESAILVAEARLNKALGYKVATDTTELTILSSAGYLLTLPERARSVSVVTDAFPGREAGTVETVTYSIRNKGFQLHRSYPWFAGNSVVVTGEFGFEETDDEYILARQFVLSLAVRMLAGTSADGMPTPAGAFLRGYSTEGASFDFFTPTSDSSGYQDLDLLLDQIGRHPVGKKKDGIYTITLARETRDLGPEAVWLGLERP